MRPCPPLQSLHLHDRDWVYVPEKDKQFRRIEVVGGDMLPDGMQEVVSGIAPANKSLLMRSNSRTRWNSNDSRARRFRFEQPLCRAEHRPASFCVGRHRVSRSCRSRPIPTLRIPGSR